MIYIRHTLQQRLYPLVTNLGGMIGGLAPQQKKKNPGHTIFQNVIPNIVPTYYSHVSVYCKFSQ